MRTHGVHGAYGLRLAGLADDFGLGLGSRDRKREGTSSADRTRMQATSFVMMSDRLARLA